MQLPDFSRHRILVAGDLMLDRYWHGSASRISPEAPVPVVRVEDIEERAGGAGNVALNIAALGCGVDLVGPIGEDEAGYSLRRLLESQGIACHLLTLATVPTITKLRVLSRHQQLIRLDFEDTRIGIDPLPLHDAFRQRLGVADVVILSDYGKGGLREVSTLIGLARREGKPVVVDPKGSDFRKYRGATLMTPNRSEFEAVVGRCRNDAELVERGMILLEELALNALLVTRGEQGMTLLQHQHPALHLPTHAREVYDVTGAGDTVISVLGTALAAGLSIPDATRLANMAAGVVVGKLGTATVSAEELARAAHGQPAHRRGITDEANLLAVMADARRQGEVVVATNGCFDILHPGHVDYLQRARALGDRLMVLVNTDASVQRLKGPTRPVNPLDHRMTMLAALECVDWVTSFDEDTPRDLIGRLLPDILVKGGDYSDITTIAGHEQVLAHGGEVRLLDFVEGYSTTRIIDRIHSGGN